ncbi:TIGR03364 family FAD-dependent oxidoreductase [Rudanella paleaurantiibacter]|uniref:TIGR03364 family FAD-dependent oxidoreductase n=1 Tax=Rudanella paleaurantiibacter TaxID=2614655 RepID=A0A7J5TYI5_9BACT|nr:TIGR03364 family FAD-dependent oxidoreductase [Rudanella paleaurantiibacter]KAB7730192.1 TIGR03364 family FAD-dependent oxidoreductase [Rudanella paleaurantiibacter]
MPVYDLIIVGAGALGTFHAYHAAKAGKRVLLLEKDNRPVSSTVRNFGQVVPSGLSGRWYTYGRRSLEIYREIQAQADISVRQNGSVYIASDADEWALANELYDRRRADGYPCELLSAAQTLARYPYLRSEYVYGGLLFPDEVSVEPDRMIYRVIDFVVARYGVTYLPNAAVVACASGQGRAEIQLADGRSFEAERVLIANGYEFRLLYPQLFAQSGLVVSKLQMMQTVPMPELAMPGNILTGLTIRRYESFAECPSYAGLSTPEHLRELKEWGIHVLFKQAVDGSIIIGDSHEYAPANQIDDLGFDTKDAVNTLILNEAARIVNFPVGQIARTWAGLYAQTDDEIYEHWIDDHIQIVTGIGGKGMTSSAGYAEQSVLVR